MSIQQNPFADVPENSHITEDAASFIEQVTFDQIPAEALRIGTRCLLDGLGLYVAGSDHETARIQAELAAETGGTPEALLLGRGDLHVPAPLAARVLGTAGHAHDWDDSQVSKDPDHVYGLLTHPTIPPLTATLTVAQKLEKVSGRDFMLAFLTGFEVEAKISEWMFSQHYKSGFHSSGTVGTFGAFASAAKLMGLEGDQLRHGLGLAASFAAGIRCNFGTMTKPLHVGRAAENGVTAALMAAKGFSADKAALDGPWGFFAVQGGGVTHQKLGTETFGQPWSIVEPGVSIKPYPCGVLTHPTIDLMVKLVKENNIAAEAIERVIVRAGSNILNPIRYPIASNHLEAKFSLPAVLAMVAINGKAGKVEFEDDFVQSDAMQKMQRQIETRFDPEIEAMGFDKMRSNIEILLKDGTSVRDSADERYRGGPENPLTDSEVEAKVRGCCEGTLDEHATRALIRDAWNVLQLDNAAGLAQLIQPDRA
ncbi:MmgE/PrpD family protein [Marinobacterium rhizophilum]|uniref:MmgE/PrpD family protein n=1 Tax=Marinobacterium rhizophilum TaxID=420402 RepID=A0ABY5HGZ2_9GAMM|nr:MmgE/PrpD family protein [Marinobacterium rhizophilum]UTW11394.1 MmgE/PrpD family protein [Marinobacterium rhizophilum]